MNFSRLRLSQMVLFTGLLLITFSGIQTAKAEGSHPNPANQGGGIDRMVYAPSVDAQGNPVGGYLGALATVQLGAYLPQNPWQDNHAFYLGATQPTTNVMMDTGVAWEINLVPQQFKIFMGLSRPGADKQYILIRKWIPAPGQTPPGYWHPLNFPQFSKDKGNFTLNFNIDPIKGYASLNIAGEGTIYWSTSAVPDPATGQLGPNTIPTQPVNNVNQEQLWPDISVATPVFAVGGADYQSIGVKRVVALNRKGAVPNGRANPNGDPMYDDGAFMYAAVSSCEYNRKKPDATWETGFWSPAQVDQIKTGYDSEPNTGQGATSPFDALTANGARTPDSHYVVNFPQTSCGYGSNAENFQNETVARTDVPQSWYGQVIGNSISRYAQEYVQIWARKAPAQNTRPVQRRHPRGR